MSSSPSSSPVVILPSTQEDVNAYLKAVRLAFSVAHSKNAENKGINKDNATVQDDSSDYRLPKTPTSTSTETAHAEYYPVPFSTRISSAHVPLNTTDSGLVQPRELHLAPSTSVNKVAEASAGATLEALKRPHGHFPPPYRLANAGTRLRLEDIGASIPAGAEPETLEHSLADSSEASPRHTGPIPIAKYQGLAPLKSYVPAELVPQRQPYVSSNRDNHTFTVCPVAKRTTNLFHISDSIMCEAPIGINQQIACGYYNGWFVAGFFVLFAVLASIWIKCRNSRTQRRDEEGGTAAWPRPLTVSTNAAGATPKLQAFKASTNKAVAKLKGKIHRAQEQEGGMDEEPGTEQYELLVWRSTSRRAERANVEGIVNHDAGPVGELPVSVDGLPAEHLFEPVPPRYDSIDGLLM